MTPELVILAERGALVGRKTKVGDEGLCVWADDGEPAEASAIADAAGLELEVCTLARVISSEHGRDATVVKVAVAHAVVNACGHGGIFRRACAGSLYFGRQDVGGRYASTAQDHYAQHVQIAQAVYDGQLADTTNGATNFFSPRAQRVLHLRDAEKWKTAEEVDERWRARGLEAVDVLGIDPDLVTFYRRA